MSRTESNFVIMGIGHEPEKIGDNPPDAEIIKSIRDCIRIKLKEYKQKHPDIWVITHMRRGCGQYIAEVCIECGVPFTAALAYENFEANWPSGDQYNYYTVLNQANEVYHVSSGEYAGYKPPVRDKWMMENSNCAMVIYHPQHKSGETLHCLGFLQKANFPAVILQPSIQTKAREIRMEIL